MFQSLYFVYNYKVIEKKMRRGGGGRQLHNVQYSDSFESLTINTVLCYQENVSKAIFLSCSFPLCRMGGWGSRNGSGLLMLAAHHLGISSSGVWGTHRLNEGRCLFMNVYSSVLRVERKQDRKQQIFSIPAAVSPSPGNIFRLSRLDTSAVSTKFSKSDLLTVTK